MLQIRDVTKSYTVGDFTQVALDRVSMDFPKTAFVAILGPSGSGKTTFLNIIGGLDRYDDGDLIINGKSTKDFEDWEWDAYRNNSVGFIFQSYNLLAVHTVFENVEFPLLLLNIGSTERRKMVMDALEWVGLTDKVKQKPPQLSGGESQRVAIARAMVKKPSLVLADEPTANLDAANSHNILKTMETLNREMKTTFLFATHDDKVISYLRRKIFLADGRVEKEERTDN